MREVSEFSDFAARYFGDGSTVTLAPWQVTMAERLVDAMERGDTLIVNRPRRSGQHQVDRLMRAWFAEAHGAPPALAALAAGWGEVADRFAALDPAVRLALLDPEFHTEDQEAWDDEPEFCWRCDSANGTTPVGLCDECFAVLAPVAPTMEER